MTYYSPRAWACYQKMLDPALNWGGYGYDIWLQNYMIDDCALREPIMGILDEYTATHAHNHFATHVHRQFQVAARAHNFSRKDQMINMSTVMGQRGTPVRPIHLLNSKESPNNESILHVHKACKATDGDLIT